MALPFRQQPTLFGFLSSCFPFVLGILWQLSIHFWSRATRFYTPLGRAVKSIVGGLPLSVTLSRLIALWKTRARVNLKVKAKMPSQLFWQTISSRLFEHIFKLLNLFNIIQSFNSTALALIFFFLLHMSVFPHVFIFSVWVIIFIINILFLNPHHRFLSGNYDFISSWLY